jgi:hypothetical protein
MSRAVRLMMSVAIAVLFGTVSVSRAQIPIDPSLEPTFPPATNQLSTLARVTFTAADGEMAYFLRVTSSEGAVDAAGAGRQARHRSHRQPGEAESRDQQALGASSSWPGGVHVAVAKRRSRELCLLAQVRGDEPQHFEQPEQRKQPEQRHASHG